MKYKELKEINRLIKLKDGVIHTDIKKEIQEEINLIKKWGL